MSLPHIHSVTLSSLSVSLFLWNLSRKRKSRDGKALIRQLRGKIMLAKRVTNKPDLSLSLSPSPEQAMVAPVLSQVTQRQFTGVYISCVWFASTFSLLTLVPFKVCYIPYCGLSFFLDSTATLVWHSKRSTNQVNAQHTYCASNGLDFSFRSPLPRRARDDRV
ncbi:hypothetical protein F4810DRAFT_19912 [Camillea tinctor]|nr:hypothetical protein F4810DRAFT_19912 [Camillea tinctor]